MLARTASALTALILVVAVFPASVAAATTGATHVAPAQLRPTVDAGNGQSTTPPKRKLALGVAELPDSGSVYNNLAPVTAYTKAYGRSPAIWTLWRDWLGASRRFPSKSLLNGLYVRHIVPMINWQPNDPNHLNDNLVPYRLIARGRFDTYIRNWALQAKTYGHPLIIRFAQEMDGAWMPWQVGKFGNTATRFMSAWRHIWQIFKGPTGVGATNVRFLWSPFSPDADSAKFYPGNRYVDYVGFTGLNWSDGQRPWKSMKALYAKPMYGLAQITTKKRVIVAEAGTVNRLHNGLSRKPGWIKIGYPAVYAAYPRIVAIIYFDVKVPSQADWRLKTPAAAVRAYRVVVKDQRFQGRLRW